MLELCFLVLIRINSTELFLLCFWQPIEGFIRLELRGWGEAMRMAMMNHITFMLSICTTWTGWNIRSWRCLLVFSQPSALVSLFPSMLSFSSRKRLHLAEFWCLSFMAAITEATQESGCLCNQLLKWFDLMILHNFGVLAFLTVSVHRWGWLLEFRIGNILHFDNNIWWANLDLQGKCFYYLNLKLLSICHIND